jgi:hypothetical protein
MERFFPDWKKAIKTMAKESTQAGTSSEKPQGTPPHQKSSSPAKKQPAGTKKK